MITALVLRSQNIKADLDTDMPLNFGTVAITANDIVSSTRIRPNGEQTSTNRMWIIAPGAPGVYTISGLAPFTTVSLVVDIPETSAELYPDTAQFTVSAVELPTTVKMDASGQSQFTMGATLETSGNVYESYYNALYRIFLNITLTY